MSQSNLKAGGLNDRRAVYRSRLSIDDDFAARSASRARSYLEIDLREAATADAALALAIEPGSTARDIKRQVGLPDDYLISREGSGQYFADNEELFGLAEGAKLRATPPATVGGTHATGRRIVVDAISAVAVWHP